MHQRSPVIAFLIPSPFEFLDLAGPASVFSFPKTKGKLYYNLQILSTSATAPVTSGGAIPIGGACRFSDYKGPIDTLIVVGGYGAVEHQTPELMTWLRKRAPNTRRITSVCTGAFILASAGLLKGRRVVTHWRFCDLFRKRFSDLSLEQDPIFIKDGKYYTTAGVSAGIDLALALVEEDRGHAEAATIAREIVLFLRRPGNQAQYSTLLSQQEEVTDKRLRDLPVWARDHLTRKLDVKTLADAVAMSPRTFARQFQITFGTTPARWVQQLRVEAARQYLESPEVPLKRIVHNTGFRDEQAMRRAFMHHLSLTPKEYRERFGTRTSSTSTRPRVAEATVGR